jgi:putative ABC transport system permease protein
MAMGIFISMKVFNIPDITTDGSYTLGASVTAILLTQQYSTGVTLLWAMVAGALAGICTGVIHTKLRIDALLSGIMVMTALYSVNLIIMGRSNVPLLQTANIFSNSSSENSIFHQLTVAGIMVIVLFAILVYLLRSDFGISMRAAGNNPVMTKAFGINNDVIKIIGLAIANALTGLSGFLVSQYQGFADINMGIGIVITGLGSVLIGDSLRKLLGIRGIGQQILLVILGSIVFQMVLAYTLSLGVDPNLLKLITSVFVLAIVGISAVGEKMKNK